MILQFKCSGNLKIRIRRFHAIWDIKRKATRENDFRLLSKQNSCLQTPLSPSHLR